MGARKIGTKICRAYSCERFVKNKHPRALYCDACRTARKNSSAAISTKNRRLEEKKKVIYSVLKENNDLLDDLADRILKKMTKQNWSVFLGKKDKEGRSGGVIIFGRTFGKTKQEKWLNKLYDEQKIRDEKREEAILKEKSKGNSI